jgi:hypothetical protein
MRYLIFIVLVILCSSPTNADELRLILDTSETWHDRDNRFQPENDQEILALRAVVAGATINDDRLTAYYSGKTGDFDLVTIDEAPENSADLHSVTSYRVCNNKICGNTRSKFISLPKSENEQVARKIAIDHLHGKTALLPVIFNGYVYIVQYEGKCNISVIEKDETTVQFIYRYNCCN